MPKKGYTSPPKGTLGRFYFETGITQSTKNFFQMNKMLKKILREHRKIIYIQEAILLLNVAKYLDNKAAKGCWSIYKTETHAIKLKESSRKV